AILLAFSVASGLTNHLRYVLPCFPFVFIWISRIANLSLSGHRLLLGLAVACLDWSILSSLFLYPHSLSYFNEIVGGPRQGDFHLAASNIDYEQDLLLLKRWYDAHPEARPLGIAYSDLKPVDPHLAGIDYFVAPSGVVPPPAGQDDPQ